MLSMLRSFLIWLKIQVAILPMVFNTCLVMGFMFYTFYWLYGLVLTTWFLHWMAWCSHDCSCFFYSLDGLPWNPWTTSQKNVDLFYWPFKKIMHRFDVPGHHWRRSSLFAGTIQAPCGCLGSLPWEIGTGGKLRWPTSSLWMFFVQWFKLPGLWLFMMMVWLQEVEFQ